VPSSSSAPRGALAATLAALLLAVVDSATIYEHGAMLSAAPACALANGSTTVSVVASGAPASSLTCRFLNNSVARTLRDAEEAVATLKLEFDDTNAWAAGLAEDLQGVLPGPVAEANASAYDAYVAAAADYEAAHLDALRLAAEADPVAVDSRTDAPDPTDAATTVTTVECAVPAGVGGLLTVALVSTSGDESAPIHNATRLEPAARVRRHSLDVASPAAGPTTGGTVIAFTGEGFEAPMRCLFYRDSEPTVVPAVVESAVRARCVAPAGSGATQASLAFEDGCFGDFGFNYYAAPEVLSVRPSGGPRFGSVNVTVFITNAWFLEQYAQSGSMTPTCAFGMASDAETAAAAATLVGYPGEDGASVVCVTPNTSVARGDHVVRVSFNAQQYAAPWTG